jgi:hypothetical protein
VINKILAAAAVAASIAAVSATVAPQAMAIGSDEGTTAGGNGSAQIHGTTYTSGTMSPRSALIADSPNHPCVALPAKADPGSLAGGAPIAVQHVNVLSSPQNPRCTGDISRVEADDTPSQVLGAIPVASGNGRGNG